MNGPYRVVVTREGDAWLADVPGVEGAHTWARDLKKLDRYVCEALALALDLPDGAEAALDLRYEYRTGDETVDAAAAELRAARDEYERLGRYIGERTRTIAGDLARTGWSIRDIAALVGVSFQRVAQILTGSAGAAAPPRAGQRAGRKAVSADARGGRASP